MTSLKRLFLTTITCLIPPAVHAAQALHITGTVMDSLSSAGISGAKAKLLEFPSITATTSSDGTFSLEGSIAVLPRKTSKFPERILLTGKRISLHLSETLTPVILDAYAGNGTRVFHAERTTDAGGRLDLQATWSHPGRYTVVLKIPGRVWTFTSIDLGDGREPWIDLQKTENAGALGKSNSTFTLQFSANGYLTKNLSLGNTDTAVGAISLVKASEETGIWTNVTPAEMAADGSGFGAGSIAADPLRPSDMYVGGSKSGLWKTTDYGKTWNKINDISPDITRGCIIAVAPTTPATVYIAGFRRIFKSTNAGATFDTLATDGFDPYSLTIDPYDPNHLLSGLHEAPDVIESVNGGVTWKKVGSGSIGGGVSVYPFFIDMGNATATRTTWLAIGQNGSSPGRTTNSGDTWTMPSGLTGLEHPHGNAAIFQKGPNLWLGGAYDFRGTIMRSTDYGVTWSKVTTDEKPEAVVWGTNKNVYAMYAWACSHCDVATNFAHAPLPGGSEWTYELTPSLKIGPNSVAVADNGTHNVFVGLMWAEGLWRFVEP